MIERERLLAVLHYNDKTGMFVWLKTLSRNVKAGTIAGYINKDGYRVIKIDGRLYAAHRLAWLYMKGYVPPMIDHRNRVRSDNAFENLRSSDSERNQHNTGLKKGEVPYKGVSIDPRSGKYQAKIRYKGKRYTFYGFNDPIFAALAYDYATQLLRYSHAETNESLGLCDFKTMTEADKKVVIAFVKQKLNFGDKKC